jgi:hypothetical protein
MWDLLVAEALQEEERIGEVFTSWGASLKVGHYRPLQEIKMVLVRLSPGKRGYRPCGYWNEVGRFAD